MRITKVIETTLDVVGDDMYAFDLDQMCIGLLIKKYVGRNYKSCLIIEVTRILRRSNVRMLETLDGKASVDVQFEVKAIVYIENEVVHGCKVVSKYPDRIHLKSEHAVIIITNASFYMGACEVGDIIPTVMERVRYSPGESLITMKALPFLPHHNKVIYKLTDSNPTNFRDEEAEEIDSQKLTPAEKKVTDFFASLTEPKKRPLIPIEKMSGYVIIDPCRRGVYSVKQADIKDEDVVVEKSMEGVGEMAIRQYGMHVRMLDGFRKTYKSMADVKALSAVWKMYSSAK